MHVVLGGVGAAAETLAVGEVMRAARLVGLA
jgi:hypothetical protein